MTPVATLAGEIFRVARVNQAVFEAVMESANEKRRDDAVEVSLSDDAREAGLGGTADQDTGRRAPAETDSQAPGSVVDVEV